MTLESLRRYGLDVSIQAALRMALEKYGGLIPLSGSPKFKVAAIQSAVDARLPITFTDPYLEHRRLKLTQQAQQGSPLNGARLPAVISVGQNPHPHRRNGPRALAQLDVLRIEDGTADRLPQVAAPRPSPAVSEQERRRAKLQAEMEAKNKRLEGTPASQGSASLAVRWLVQYIHQKMPLA